MHSEQIRTEFCRYFQGKGHVVQEPMSLVPAHDPTLLFTNAGMVPFKDVFCGNTPPPNNVRRAVSVQPCVRAGGKHNDLEHVGYSTRHHTFFEMLGNFSFGDYFKEEAIAYAWEFVHGTLHIPQEKLYVTVHRDDKESAQLWRRIAGFDSGRIIALSDRDNFWSMGEDGPCGPCTEIFYDYGDAYEGAPPSESSDGGQRFVEIWNLVFMQYQRSRSGQLTPLDRFGVDTGMGLERITSVMQDVHNNYDNDLFRPLLAYMEERGAHAEHYRHGRWVLADHIRSLCFLIADGVSPSNEGRGYVLRRLMRRAMRYEHAMPRKGREASRATSKASVVPVPPQAHEMSLLLGLAPILIDMMATHYAHLVRHKARILDSLQREYVRFHHALEQGMEILQEAMASIGTGESLSGEKAFMLYDTYGFPLDMTEDIARGRGICVDKAGFDRAMHTQKSRALKAHRERHRKHMHGQDDRQDWTWLDEHCSPSQFVGYESLCATARVEAIIDASGESVTSLEGYADSKEGHDASMTLLMDRTPFYGESGGQVGDRGVFLHKSGDPCFSVRDTQRACHGRYILHHGYAHRRLKVGDMLTLSVDGVHRHAVSRHHSTTHILHEALRRLLGDHVAQKGSLVTDQRVRFDFTHDAPIGEDDWAQLARDVNHVVMENGAVSTHVMDYHSAVAKGARALFGERYGERVRVVSIGVDEREGDKAYSLELCGGSHVTRSGDIGAILLLSQSAVGAGIRRIEAVAGHAAHDAILSLTKNDHALQQLVKASSSMMALTKVREWAKIVQHHKKAQQRQRSQTSFADVAIKEDVVGVYRLCHAVFEEALGHGLKSVAETLQKKTDAHIACAIALDKAHERIAFVLKVIEPSGDIRNAHVLARHAAQRFHGRAGGRPDLAQGGGKCAAGEEHHVIDTILSSLKEKLAS
ncbi:MAG: alanine--tRNA ligase [Alphaproteobacteria bacterium GM7ARS4]|nr:alanine--tRNA ligase [Alphaproteobacteria bacterium GM7ARS4]